MMHLGDWDLGPVVADRKALFDVSLSTLPPLLAQLLPRDRGEGLALSGVEVAAVDSTFLSLHPTKLHLKKA